MAMELLTSLTNYVVYESFGTTIFLTGVTVLLLGLLFHKLCNDQIRLFKLATRLPGPPALPLFGNVLQLATNSDDSLDKLFRLVTRYQTPMRFWLGPKLLVVLTEPRDYEVCMRKFYEPNNHESDRLTNGVLLIGDNGMQFNAVMQSSSASHKDWTYRFMATYSGNGLVTASGPYHRAQRKLVAPMHSAKALNSFIAYFNRHTRICVQLLADQIDKGEFNIQHYMAQCTWDFVTETVLGVPSSVQTSKDKSCVIISERLYELVYERSTKIWYHSDYLFSFSSLAKEQKMGQDMIENLVGGAIAQKKEYLNSQKRGDNNAPKLIILEQLIEAIMESKLMSDEEIRDSIFTVFTAAQDTTAVICSFALVRLAMDQAIQDKVREEINNVVGNNDVETEHLKDLKYMEMVIKETIRLYPIGPVLQRFATGDITLDNCVIPKGCTITMVPYVTHRCEKYWPEPEKFDPERFSPENSNTRHPYAYVPFSYGVRSCIGQQYAMTCIKIMLTHIVRSYRLSTTKNPEDIRVKMDISVRSRTGYDLSLTRA